MRDNPIALFIVTLFAGCVGQVAADIYSPSIPAIAQHFGSSINQSQLSMAVYMYGLVAMLMVYGIASERFGRKAPLIVGMLVMQVGNLLCFFAGSMTMLILGRIVQGMGAASGAGLWRAIFRDAYSGAELAKFGSYFTLLVMLINPSAPVIGGYLQHYVSWRANFVFVAGFSLLKLLFVVFCYHDTRAERHPLVLANILKPFKRLLTSKVYLGASLAVSLTYGAMFSWFTVGPVLLIHALKITPVAFGWLSFITSASGFATAGYTNARLVERFGMILMLRIGWSLIIAAGVVLLISYALVGLELWTTVSALLLLFLGCCFVWANAFATAITPFGDIAGYAGPLYSLLQLSGGAVFATLVAHLPDHNSIPLALVFIVAASSAMLLHQLLVVRSEAPAQSN